MKITAKQRKRFRSGDGAVEPCLKKPKQDQAESLREQAIMQHVPPPQDARDLRRYVREMNQKAPALRDHFGADIPLHEDFLDPVAACDVYRSVRAAANNKIGNLAIMKVTYSGGEEKYFLLASGRLLPFVRNQQLPQYQNQPLQLIDRRDLPGMDMDELEPKAAGFQSRAADTENCALCYLFALPWKEANEFSLAAKVSLHSEMPFCSSCGGNQNEPGTGVIANYQQQQPIGRIDASATKNPDPGNFTHRQTHLFGLGEVDTNRNPKGGVKRKEFSEQTLAYTTQDIQGRGQQG